jgi:endonuclease/exonuclease/phosphatase family metal-dependent hydrolase
MSDVATRVLTWNLQGRERPDLDQVAAHVEAVGADVVSLQEVTRRQARRLAACLGWSVEWRFKHWSVVVPAEGLALLSPHPVHGPTTTHLAHRYRPWSWRRRIAVAATVVVPDGPLGVVVVHLGAGVGDEERTRQARLAIAALGATGAPQGVVAGDLNTHPGAPVLAALESSALRDAWAQARPGEAGPTNWRPGPRDRPPTQRLDYVMVTAGLDVVAAEVPGAGDADLDRFAALSDHLPVAVAVSVRG